MRVTLRLSGGLTSEEGSLKPVTLGARPFIVGRSPEADWTLIDPRGLVSGTHLELRVEGRDLVVVDHSTNGTSINSAANKLQKGQPASLPDSCSLVLPVGEISISVERDEPAAHALDDGEDFFSLDEIQRERAQPAQSASDAAFDSALLLGGAPARPADLPDLGHQTGGSPDLPSGPSEGLSAASLGPPPTEAPRPSTQPGIDTSPTSDNWIKDDADDGEEDIFGPPPVQAEPPPPAPQAPVAAVEPVAAPPAPAPEAPSAEALAPTEPAPAPTASLPPMPAAELPPAQPEPTQAPPQPGPSSPGADAALRALFSELGRDYESMSDEARLHMCANVGRTFGAMADAMRQMLETRADVKRALGVTATEMGIGANPLKFARTKKAALDGLIQPLSDGILSGEEAVDDSLHSMQAHQYALISGIKAALQTALKEFDPILIEKHLEQGTVGKLVPGSRKRALWDSFTENYARFREQAEENFRVVIGRELDKLYHTQRPRGDDPQ